MTKDLTEAEQLALNKAQFPIDQRIANELIGSTADTWNEILLEVEVIWHDNFLELGFQITSPEGHPAEEGNATDGLKRAVEDLVRLFKTHGVVLTKITSTASNQTGGWRMKSRYDE